jgi:hypothetical protein
MQAPSLGEQQPQSQAMNLMGRMPGGMGPSCNPHPSLSSLPIAQVPMSTELTDSKLMHMPPPEQLSQQQQQLQQQQQQQQLQQMQRLQQVAHTCECPFAILLLVVVHEFVFVISQDFILTPKRDTFST